MTLQRFNQVLWAVVGIVVLGTVLTFCVLIFGVVGLPSGNERTGILVDQEVAREDAEPQEAVVLCLPTAIPGSTTRLIGVAVVDTTVRRSEHVIGSGSSFERRFSAACKLGEGFRSFAGRIQNVLVWEPDTGGQHLLFPGRVLLNRFAAPDKECTSEEKGEDEQETSLASCDWLYWELREEDTSGDGVIDAEDALVPYVSDLDGSNLRRMTPEGAHMVSIVRDRQLGYFLQAQTDGDGDRVFGPRDPVELLQFNPATDEVPRPVASESAATAAEALLR